MGTDGPGSTDGLYPRSTFGRLGPDDEGWLRQFAQATRGLVVRRASAARSNTPYPGSVDLELALSPMLQSRGFLHHVMIRHPRTGERFEYDFWRLVTANVAWGVGVLALLAAAGRAPLVIVLAPLLALPTVGVFRVAALIARDEPVATVDGFRAWRTLGGRALVLGTALLVAGFVFTTNLMTGIQGGGLMGWSLATFAGWGLVATGLVAVVAWPLVPDPWREELPLRALVRLSVLMALAFPLRPGALLALVTLLLTVSTVALVAVLSVSLRFAALVCCRYVLPATDRFAPPPDRPERRDP